VTPIVLFIGATLYVFAISHMEMLRQDGICVPWPSRTAAPMLFRKNAISNATPDQAAFPDASTLLICIEIRHVGFEVACERRIVSKSVALSEEFS